MALADRRTGATGDRTSGAAGGLRIRTGPPLARRTAIAGGGGDIRRRNRSSSPSPPLRGDAKRQETKEKKKREQKNRRGKSPAYLRRCSANHESTCDRIANSIPIGGAESPRAVAALLAGCWHWAFCRISPSRPHRQPPARGGDGHTTAHRRRSPSPGPISPFPSLPPLFRANGRQLLSHALLKGLSKSAPSLGLTVADRSRPTFVFSLRRRYHRLRPLRPPGKTALPLPRTAPVGLGSLARALLGGEEARALESSFALGLRSHHRPSGWLAGCVCVTCVRACALASGGRTDGRTDGQTDSCRLLLPVPSLPLLLRRLLLPRRWRRRILGVWILVMVLGRCKKKKKKKSRCAVSGTSLKFLSVRTT